MTDLSGSGGLSVRTDIIRGEISWAYFYVFLGFALSIEGNIISMLPLTLPWNIFWYVVSGGFTCWLLDKRWVQDGLIRFKNWVESKPR